MALLPFSLAAAAEELVVAVELNGQRVSDGEVIQADDTGIQLSRSFLDRIHLANDGTGDPVSLASIKGLSAALDRSSLVLRLTASPKLFPATVYSTTPYRFHDPIKNYGGFLNYDLHAETQGGNTFASGLFEVGTFMPLGVLLNDVVTSTSFNTFRLRSTYLNEMENGDLLLGDSFLGQSSVGNGFPFGGIQWQTGDFIRRRILSTTISSEIANPAQVDVFVNNALVQSQRVPAGTFVFENLPTFTGDGNVRLVVRDALGREQVTTRSFYQSASLLHQGMSDFSYEAGMLRENYGFSSFDYTEPFVSGTHRYGFTDDFTAEVHGEASQKRQMAETQLSYYIPYLGVASIGGGGSNHDGNTGWIVTYGFDQQYQSWLHYGYSGARATRDFTQLGDGINNVKQIRERDQGLVGIDLGPSIGSISASVVRVRLEDEPKFTTAAATWNYPIGHWASLSTTVFSDLDHGRNHDAGFSLNLTIPLGANSFWSSSMSRDAGGYRGETAYFKQPENIHDGFGYRAFAGGGELSRQAAGATYYSPFGDFAADVGRFNNQMYASVNASGGFGYIDGKTFAAKRIDGSFGVADTGTPKVAVYQDRQLIGKTGDDGRIIIPKMRPNEINSITIDPADIPLDRNPETLERRVVPAKFSGSTVRFGMQEQHEASITIVYANGKVVAPASTAIAEGKTYLIGYDGLLYLSDLRGTKELEIHDGDIVCRVRVSPKDRRATCS